jgi:UDP-glucose 4-epimerase
MEPKIQYLEARNEVVHAYSAHEKARATFGQYIQDVDLPAGIKKMAAWAKDIGVRSSEVFKEIELAKNLPPSWKIER